MPDAPDMTGPIYSQYLQAHRSAIEAEKKGSIKRAAEEYAKAARLLRMYVNSSPNYSDKEDLLQKSNSLERIAQKIRGLPEGTLPQIITQVPEKSQVQKSVKKSDSEDGAEFDEQIKQLITKSKTTWKDVAGMVDTKAAIKNAYFEALAKKPPQVEINGARGILLYGPPGTGKTLLAAATAGSLDATFFNAKSSDMLSKWFGESTQKVSALFRVARSMNPSVIFMDEIEALTISRTENTNSANLQVVTTLLAELDGMDFKDKDQFVLSIGATNVPWLLDTGILRRFPKRIYVPLPDLELRKSIFEIHITKKGHKTAMPISTLAERTDGFSGDEIKQLCNTAVEYMIHRMNPDSQQIVDRGRDAVRDYMLKVDTIQESEFEKAFTHVKPITDAKAIERFQKWAENTKD